MRSTFGLYWRLASLVGVLAIFASGCGSAPDAGLREPAVKKMIDDLEPLTKVIESVQEKAASDAAFKDLFVDGKAPLQDRSKYSALKFSVDGIATIDGEWGQVWVQPLDAKGAELPNVYWKFKKAGEAWKIIDAPLPSERRGDADGDRRRDD